MTSKEAFTVLKTLKHAYEMAEEFGLYGRMASENVRKKEIEALDYAIKLQDKIDYKIETLEEELSNLCGKHARGGGKPIAVMTRIHEIAYALEVLKWLELEVWAKQYDTFKAKIEKEYGKDKGKD